MSDLHLGDCLDIMAGMDSNSNFVGVERDQEYFEIAKARIEAAQLPILQECQALPIF